MKDIREDKQIVGVIHTMNGDYSLLELTPVKGFVPVHDAYNFYVLNALGYATHIMVKGDFVIERYPVMVVQPVYFVIDEDEKEAAVEFPSPL